MYQKKKKKINNNSSGNIADRCGCAYLNCFRELVQDIGNRCSDLFFGGIPKTKGKIILSNIKRVQSLREVLRPRNTAFTWCDILPWMPPSKQFRSHFSSVLFATSISNNIDFTTAAIGRERNIIFCSWRKDQFTHRCCLLDCRGQWYATLID